MVARKWGPERWAGTKIDHFNWYQEITGISIPGVGQISIDDPSKNDPFGIVTALASRGLGPDPLPGGNPINKLTCLGAAADPYLFYYDEVAPDCPTGVGWDAENLLSSHTLSSQLEIFDSPKQRIPGTVVTFSDYLVGVTPDKKPVFFNDIDGLGFKWQFTQGSFRQRLELRGFPKLHNFRG